MIGSREARRCYPEEVFGVNVGLVIVAGAISFLAFFQLIRIHSRNLQLGWTRQKVFHLMIGSSNLGYFINFNLLLVAGCKDWICWSYSCGFIAMAFPKIVLFASFLLLLSFWVDLCHQSNDDDEDDECGPQESLLQKMELTDTNHSGCRRWCFFSSIHIGWRQKIVIAVNMLIFIITLASTTLIWIWRGNSTLNSGIVAQVYIDLIAALFLLLGGALACYGLALALKMRKVRSERSSSEMWKVAGLAIVSIISFSSSSSVAIATNIPLFYHRDGGEIDGVYTSLLLVLYYLIGSSLPSGFILYVMKELPPPPISKREESETIAFISEGSVSSHNQQRWTAAASMGNQVSRASPMMMMMMVMRRKHKHDDEDDVQQLIPK